MNTIRVLIAMAIWAGCAAFPTSLSAAPIGNQASPLKAEVMGKTSSLLQAVTWRKYCRRYWHRGHYHWRCYYRRRPSYYYRRYRHCHIHRSRPYWHCHYRRYW